MRYIIITAEAPEVDKIDDYYNLKWSRLNEKTYPDHYLSEDQMEEVKSDMIAKFGDNYYMRFYAEVVDEKFFEEFGSPYL